MYTACIKVFPVPRRLLRFRPVAAKEIIHGVVMETLRDKQYSPEHVSDWTREISDSIKAQLKGKWQRAQTRG